MALPSPPPHPTARLPPAGQEDEELPVALPPLTPEQRQAALDKAAASRKERAEVKNRLKHAGYTVADVIEERGTTRSSARCGSSSCSSRCPASARCGRAR